MTKPTSALSALPPELLPNKTSAQLINSYIERLRLTGVPQKVIALALGFGSNYVSMLKKGEELPLSRVIAFAHAAQLNESERQELLHTRLLELHGAKGEICVETLAQWASDLCAPEGDAAILLALWREVTSPAPHLVAGLLTDPLRANRIRAAMDAVVQEELCSLAEEAAHP